MNYIIWKDKDSRNITGLLISELPPISKPKMRVQETVIDGVDGSLIEELGYESYDKTLQIGLTKGFDIDEVIKYFSGEGNIVFSNEPDKFYKARIIEQIDYERLLRFRTASIKFRVQPFKYEYQEETIEKEQKSIEGSNIQITDGNIIGLQIDGKCEQETTQGTNYFDATKIDSSSKIITTENGRTLTLPLLTSGAGVVPIGKLGVVCPNLKVGDTVYCFFTRKYDSVSNFIYLATSTLRWDNGTSKTITQEMLDSVVYLYANNVNRDEDFQQVLYDFRIVKNSTDEWEKFTNNQPSPNPKYPQEIEVIEGDLSFKVDNGLETIDENYQEQIVPLDLKGNWVGKINNDIKDYLVTDKKKYLLVKNVDKIVLNGSENWSLNSSYNAFMLYSNLSKGGNVISNYYRGITQGLSTNDNVVLFNPTTLYVKDSSIKDVTEFKNILKERYESGNPVEIYFPLAQPYTEELGELLEPIKTFEGVSNISNSENANMIIDYIDNKLIVNNIGNYTSKPIIELEGAGIVEFILNGNKLFRYTFQEGENSVVIDSQKQDAYLGTILKNRNMNGEFPELKVGENIITWEGTISNIKISSKSRWL